MESDSSISSNCPIIKKNNNNGVLVITTTLFNTLSSSLSLVYHYSFNSDDIHLNGGGRPQLTDSMVRPSCYDTTLLVYKLYKKHGNSNNSRRIRSLAWNNNKSCEKLHNQLVEFSVVRHQVRECCTLTLFS